MIVTMKKAAVSLRAKRMGRSPGPIQDSPQVEHLSVQCNVNLGSCWCEGISSIPNVPYIWSYARVAYVVWIQCTSATTAMEYLRHSTFSKRTSQNPQDS